METMIGEVPADWCEQRLDECCQLQPGPGGSAFASTDRVADGVPVVAGRDIADGRIASAPAVRVSPEAARRRDRYRTRAGDILLVRVSREIRHAMVDAGQEGWLIGGSCIRIRPTGSLLPGYLNHYLTHPSVRDWLSLQVHEGVISTITTGRLGGLPVVLPPIEIQSAVVDLVRAVDAKIEVHEATVRATRALRDLLLPELLSGRLVADRSQIDRYAGGHDQAASLAPVGGGDP